MNIIRVEFLVLMDVLISVVIPTYNRAAELRKCLSSLSNQEYGRDRYEVVVVDDDSRDYTQSVIEEFKNRIWNLKVILNDEKRGSNYARNVGVRYAEGGIVAFIDSDCIAPKDWLLKIEEAFQKDVDCVQGSWECKGKWELPVSKEEILKMPVYRVRHGLNTRNLVIRKEIALKHPFNVTYGRGGDYELGRRLAESDVKVEYNSDILVVHYDKRNFWQIIQKGKIRGKNYFLSYQRWGWKGINPRMMKPLWLLAAYYSFGVFYYLVKYRSPRGALSSSVINILAANQFKKNFSNKFHTRVRGKGEDFFR